MPLMLLLTAHGPVAVFRCVILVVEIGKILGEDYLRIELKHRIKKSNEKSNEKIE